MKEKKQLTRIIRRIRRNRRAFALRTALVLLGLCVLLILMRCGRKMDREYTGQDDHAAFDALAGRFAALDIVLRTVFQKPSFVEKLFFASYVRKLMKQYYSL